MQLAQTTTRKYGFQEAPSEIVTDLNLVFNSEFEVRRPLTRSSPLCSEF